MRMIGDVEYSMLISGDCSTLNGVPFDLQTNYAFAKPYKFVQKVEYDLATNINYRFS